MKFVPYLTYSSPYTTVILSVVLTTFFLLIPVVHMLPMRATCLVLGLSPFFLTHPFTQHTLFPTLQSGLRHMANAVRFRALRVVDDDNLEDKHWRTELREVELWENERWAPGPNGSSEESVKTEGAWSKTNLKPGERKAWTRGRDGWSGVSDDGSGEVRLARSSRLSPRMAFRRTLSDIHPLQQQSNLLPGRRLGVCRDRGLATRYRGFLGWPGRRRRRWAAYMPFS